MTRRAFAGSALAAALAADAPVRCKLLDANGEPLTPAQLEPPPGADSAAAFHICDLVMRTIPIAPSYEGGEIRFRAPREPFRIGVPFTVPAFGRVILYADDRGRGHTGSRSPLFLNLEFAADRLATVRRLLEECRASGASIPAATVGRIDRAAALFRRAGNASDREAAAVSAESLTESLLAGEDLVLERARHGIARRGLRPGFLFGCNSFAYVTLGKPYAECFEALFNYATLPFYWRSVLKSEDQPDYAQVATILRWQNGTKILKKGHPLAWFQPRNTPDWLRSRPYKDIRAFCETYAERSVARFRASIRAWDIINEAHLFTNSFSKEEMTDLTAALSRAVRRADPTCFRVVNICCNWSDYMARAPKPGQCCVYDYLDGLRRAEVEYEALGLQYYYQGRDMLEIERSIETFRRLGKPIHITELEVPSESGEGRNAWRGTRWSESLQAEWLERFYTMAFSKPWIEAITWWDLADTRSFIPHGGLVRDDLSPKESYTRLRRLIREWTAN